MELRGGESGRPLTEDEAGRVLNGVLDSGITFIDTSIDYGESEERIGRHLSHRRDEFFLASKCGCLNGDRLLNKPEGRFPHDFTRVNIVEGVEQSLRRLNTDHLEPCKLHASPSKEVLGAARRHRNAARPTGAGQSAVHRHCRGPSRTFVITSLWVFFDVFQIPYSCLQREHEGADCASRGGGRRRHHPRRRGAGRAIRERARPRAQLRPPHGVGTRTPRRTSSMTNRPMESSSGSPGRIPR